MPLVVVGSVALDRVQTPTETRDDLLGGSGSYFAYAASYFTPVKLVSVVGEDWPDEYTLLLQSRNVDTAGLQLVPGGKTFRWSGRYLEGMNQRETLEVHLNAMAKFDPVLPEEYRRCQFLFLANDPPALQMKVLEQCPGTRLTVADTMDLWIDNQRDELVELLGGDFPNALEKARDINRILNEIFNRQHELDLAFLRNKTRRDAKDYLQKIPGVDACTLARVMLVSVGGHALPVDENMLAYLRRHELVDSGAEAAEVQAFLERNIAADDAYAFYMLMRRVAATSRPRPQASGTASKRRKTGRPSKTKRTAASRKSK